MPGNPNRPAHKQPRPDVKGRALAAIQSAGRAGLHGAFDDDDRESVRDASEDAWAGAGRPLDQVMSVFGVDAATAEAMLRESL